ncbi:hypothetical protein KPH14_007800 [Odynerus spinipes]|uniref:Dynein regulatory complex protein 9 n=1 Tax=Odynerus spinipes TaxID=1348599 RepID=A0AAD9RFI0_9HYME|nr:hypothetical protein KPH14_007800 [Odynerus spinipes]
MSNTTNELITRSEIIVNDRDEEKKLGLRNAFAAISSVVLDQSRGGAIDVRERSTEDTAFDIAAKKSAHVLAKNLEKMSKIDMEMMVEEGIKEKKRKEDEERTMSVSDVEPKRFLQGEDLIRYRKRGTIHMPRSSIFPLTIALLGAETGSIDSRPKGDDKETSISKMSTLESRHDKSENVGVWSMQIDVPPQPALSSYEATAIGCVLKECVDQLTVLRYAIPAEVNDRWENIVKPINEKYDVPDEPQRVFREEANLPPLTLSVSEKLQRDRTYMHDILNQTLDEVKRVRRFDILEEEVNKIVRMLEDEHNLEENCAIWKNQVSQLRALIKDERVKKEREKRELMELAQKTNAGVDDTVYEIALKMGYAEKWENARLTQQRLRFKAEEQNLLDDLNEYRKEENVEDIVTAEIFSFFQENIKDMEDDMLTWQSRYDEEIERRQRETDDLKARVEKQKLEIQDLRAVRDERQAFIDACLAEIRRIEEEAKYQETINRAATIIQAAWRGYMVRHEVGEFKDLRAQLRKRKKLAAKRRKKLEKLRKKQEKKDKAKKSSK